MNTDGPVLVLNPGAHTTRVGVFSNDGPLFADTIVHDEQELAGPRIIDQLPLRSRAVSEVLDGARFTQARFSAVVGRGGLMRPVPGGTYLVCDRMLDDLRAGIQGEHASNLGAWLAREFAVSSQCLALVVDPVATDEFVPEARLSGHRDIVRRSLGHALNIKATARATAKDLGLPFEQASFVIAHLGSGISVAACRKGKLVDINNANEEGPFGPERSGGLPVPAVIAYAAARTAAGDTPRDIGREFTRRGGLISYVGTRDVPTAERRAAEGDELADLALRAMAYQVAKEIGAMATALAGRVNAVILTGAMARSERVTTLIRDRVAFLGPVIIHPGERELEAMADGALRVLSRTEPLRRYPSGEAITL